MVSEYFFPNEYSSLSPFFKILQVPLEKLLSPVQALQLV